MVPSNNHLQHVLDYVLFKKRQYVVLYTLSQQTKRIKVKLRKVIPVTCRFGRKKSIIACLILAAFSSFGSVLITSEDNTSKGRSNFKGCLRGGRKILEGETTFRWVYMQKFRSVWLTVEKELKIKDNPWNDPLQFLFCLSLVLGSS